MGTKMCCKKLLDVLGNILQEWRQVYLGTPGVPRVISIVDIKGRRDRKHLTVTIHTTVTTPLPKNTRSNGEGGCQNIRTESVRKVGTTSDLTSDATFNLTYNPPSDPTSDSTSDKLVATFPNLSQLKR